MYYCYCTTYCTIIYNCTITKKVQFRIYCYKIQIEILSLNITKGLHRHPFKI